MISKKVMLVVDLDEDHFKLAIPASAKNKIFVYIALLI